MLQPDHAVALCFVGRTNNDSCLLQALQLLNSEYAQAADRLELSRAAHSDASSVYFPVGTGPVDKAQARA